MREIISIHVAFFNRIQNNYVVFSFYMDTISVVFFMSELYHSARFGNTPGIPGA